MTNIIELARQAGMAVDEQVTDYTGDKYLYVSINELQTFAALVRNAALEEAAAEAEAMIMYPRGKCEAPKHETVWHAARAIRTLKESGK